MMLLFIFNWQEANMEGDRLGGHQYWVELFPRFGAAVIRRQNKASHILSSRLWQSISLLKKMEKERGALPGELNFLQIFIALFVFY